jgi:BlaI family transcriptional regulator, penicillinase repressor
VGQLFVTVCGVVDWSIFWAALPSRDAQRLEYYLIRIHRRERRAKGRACACNHARERTTTGGAIDSAQRNQRRPTSMLVSINRQSFASARFKESCEYFTAIPILSLDSSLPSCRRNHARHSSHCPDRQIRRAGADVGPEISIFRPFCDPTCVAPYAVVALTTDVVDRSAPMSTPKLTPLEMRIMDVLWASGRCSVREIQEAFPESDRPAYTTVQTMVYRLERKKAVRRAKKISNANIFEPILTRDAARGRFIDELLGLFGSRMQPLMAHLIESGKLTLGDVKEAEEALRKLAKKGEKSGE